MKQRLAQEIILAGESVFLTGAAGSGKTYLLNQCIKLAKAGGKHVSVTATTGLAATHLGGTTIHSWSGIGIHDALPENFADHLSKGRREIIEKTDVLIIDEISMLHDYRLDMVDEICRAIRDSEQPFGGIQVVMSGDFFQLPPVNRAESRTGSFVINSRAWQELDPVICYLDEQYRQDDEKLLEILQALRAGDVRRRHAEALLARVGTQPSSSQQFTELYTTNIDVDTINRKRLAAIDGESVSYTQATTGAANYIETLQRSVLAPAELTLKKGALVMAVRNSSDRKYANGSLGVVRDFEVGTDYPVVDFINGHSATIVPESWELRDGDKKRASITQVPLRLAWAITVHKSQGMTLDAARIDLRKAFVEGMGYVALSRVQRIADLYLDGINQLALRVSAEAQSIDGSLRKKSEADQKRLAHLEINADQRSLKPIRKTAVSGSWGDKITAMRKTHPNAYKPWTKADDATLKQQFQNGFTVSELASELGRHEGSIKMRLQKHFGEDVEL